MASNRFCCGNMINEKHHPELILDSSFLMHMAKKTVLGMERISDWAVETVVLEDITRELDGIKNNQDSVQSARAAALASQYAKNLRSVNHEGHMPVDEKLIAYAEEHGAMVATLDVDLRKKLLNKGIPVVSLKNERAIMLLPKQRRP
ncbi:MAG: hypothetical protein O7B32_00990 [Thaumarchaeota archaeon]|nr:hypothetical protein [Nitrososphaerota archaeon]